VTTNLITFPIERTRKYTQAQADDLLAADPNYRFIRDLLVAIEGVGLPLDTSPEAKARELYAKYQREKQIDKRAYEQLFEQES
jgi:hypothetical protein